jgi:hypothetical protein
LQHKLASDGKNCKAGFLVEASIHSRLSRTSKRACELIPKLQSSLLNKLGRRSVPGVGANAMSTYDQVMTYIKCINDTVGHT